VFPHTSDKVGFIACIVIAIVVTIFVLWPRRWKAPPPPLVTLPGKIADPIVDAGGNPVAGSLVAPNGAPREGANLSGTPPVEVPPPAAVAVSFYDPGAPPVIE